MKVRALRGVCVGVGRHLAVGDDPVDLDPATVTFLTGIGAVERVDDAPAKPVKAEPQPESVPAKPVAPANVNSVSDKSGKKEK